MAEGVSNLVIITLLNIRVVDAPRDAHRQRRSYFEESGPGALVAWRKVGTRLLVGDVLGRSHSVRFLLQIDSKQNHRWFPRRPQMLHTRERRKRGPN